MWYNKETKDRFINTIELSQYPPNYWNNLFESLASHEELINKDFYSFTKKELMVTFKMLNYVSYETLMVATLNLKKYVLWALQQNLIVDGQNHLDEITSEELFGCVNQLQLQQSIVTREDLVRGLQQLDNYQDRFVLLGLFEGIKGDQFSDLTYAKLSDINEDDLTITLHSGSTIKMSRDLLSIAKVASEAKEYYITRKDGITKVETLYGDGIIRVVKRRYENGYNQADIRQVYHSLMRSIDIIGWSGRVSANSVFTSGVIHMINRIAEENETTAEQVLYTELFNQVRDQYGFNPNLRKRFKMKYAAFLK